MSCWEVFFGTEKPCCVMMLKTPISYNCKAHRITIKKSPTELCGVRTSVMLSVLYLIDNNYHGSLLMVCGNVPQWTNQHILLINPQKVFNTDNKNRSNIPRPRHLIVEELTNILWETCYVTKNSPSVLGRGCCLWVFDTWRNCQFYDRQRGTSIK